MKTSRFDALPQYPSFYPCRTPRYRGKRQPLDPVVPGSLVANLAHPVSWDSFVRRAPVELDLDDRFSSAQGCYRLPRLKGVGLSGARLVVRHPRNRSLSIREGADPAELVSLGPFRCH